MRIIILTSCTASKEQQRLPAERLYTGDQHRRLMRGVTAARDQGADVRVWIISARHGLIPGTQWIEPYDETFAGMPRDQRETRHQELRLDEAVGDLLTAPFGLALVCLGRDYSGAIGFRRWWYESPVLRFVATPEPGGRCPRYREIAAGAAEAKRYGCGLVGIKGEMAGRVLESGLWRTPLDVTPETLL
jgi:hypothetical protein